MKKNLPLTLFVLLFASVNYGYCQLVSNPVNYIDSRIGTANDGSNCVIGPQLPFGSINPSPQTPNGEHDGYDPGQPIRGFGQLHVSGTGWGKYGQIFVSPQIGLAVGETEHDSPKSVETAFPYEYGVTLTKYDIRTEFAPAHHSAIYKFTFPETTDGHILIDLSHNIPQDIATEIGGKISQGKISVDSINNSVSGFGNYSGGFGGGDYLVYFFVRIDKKPVLSGTWNNGTIQPKDTVESIVNVNDRIGAYLKFSTTSNEIVTMKIAISFKSIVQAKSWLDAEIPDWDYNLVKESAKTAWNKELSKILIEESNTDKLKIFYTAMYHAMLMPRNRTNDMIGFAADAPVWDDHYATWDTWRSMFPLMSLINPQMVAGNINSFIERFKKNERVHDAYIAGWDMAEEQGGNNIDNIIAEGFMHEVSGVDWEAAYSVLKNNADNDRAGWQGWGSFSINNALMASYKKQGWIPAGVMSCSKSLEYSYNDYCAALVAKGLGKTTNYTTYWERSQKWVNIWNPDLQSGSYKGFIAPKNADNTWVSIDPKKFWGSWIDYFYEGSSWTYSYFVPHQFEKLVYLTGGAEIFATKLNYGFSNNLIDYGNEPAFLAAQAFHYAHRPDLASYWLRNLISTKYSLTGVPGNDDSGAMSSLYIFGAMGFFPNAGQDIYYLTGSLYSKVSLTLANDKKLVIETQNAGVDNVYIQSCKINGAEWNKSWFRYNDIKNGAIIHFKMGNTPSQWAVADTSLNYHEPTDIKKEEKTKTGSIISPNKPNPFNLKTNFELNIPQNVRTAKLKITNLSGQTCNEINTESRGISSYVLSGSSLPQGIYFYSLICDANNLGPRKMVKQSSKSNYKITIISA